MGFLSGDSGGSGVHAEATGSGELVQHALKFKKVRQGVARLDIERVHQVETGGAGPDVRRTLGVQRGHVPVESARLAVHGVLQCLAQASSPWLVLTGRCAVCQESVCAALATQNREPPESRTAMTLSEVPAAMVRLVLPAALLNSCDPLVFR